MSEDTLDNYDPHTENQRKQADNQAKLLEMLKKVTEHLAYVCDHCDDGWVGFTEISLISDAMWLIEDIETQSSSFTV
jgi:hypothetical protein